MARNKKVEILSHDGQVLHPITDGDCVIFPDGETLTHKLSEDEAVMYTPEVVNSSPMFKVGEGDSSDYSANVLDGAYQEAVLKGQTYVNTIQEPSADVITLPTPFTEYERTQSKTFTEMQDGTFGLNLVGQSYVNCIQEPSKPSYVALGENLEFQEKKVEYTSDGQIKSAMLKGQTLVNLVTLKTTKASGEITSAKALINLNLNKSMFVPNKSYTIKLELKVNSNTNTRIYYELYGRKSDGVATTISKDIVNDNTVGTIYINDYRNNLLSSADTGKYSVDFYIAGRPIDTTLPCSYDIEVLSALFIEGDHTQEDIPYFQGMQSVTMTTELENVCSRYNSSGAKNGKTFTVGTNNERTLTLASKSTIDNYGFKQNIKYLLQFKISNLNLDGLSSVTLMFTAGDASNGDKLFSAPSIEVSKNGIYRVVVITTSLISTSSFVIKGISNQWENSTSTTRKLTISQIMCIEYQNGMENWDLPYFETTQLIKPLKIQNVNKNLFDGIWNETSSSDVKETTNYFRVTKGKTYRVSSQGIINGSTCKFYDKNKKVVKSIDGVTIQAPAEAYYAKWFLNTTDYSSVQIEESSTSTDYTPHQEKTTSALEPITLRAIGDVKDTLDLSTGEYVQRIGEITVDGVNAKAKKLVINNEWSETSRRFDLDITGVKRVAGWNGATTIIKSDKTNVFDDIGRANPQCNSLYKWDDVIVLYINDSTITTIDQANNWLEQNPIKIQYQLANPITRKISLEYPNLQTYTDITHVQSIAMDGTLIPNIYLPSDISYKAMLKPNTSYNVIVDREVIDSTNQLTVNLGGTTANITANRTVVTTPSTLSNETLTFGGKDNRLAKAMLIEGSTLINGDLPHFDGIGDVKLGRVVENLCMANHTTVGGAASTDTLYSDKITSKITQTGSKVHTFQLTKNLENGKTYFIYCPHDYKYVNYAFRRDYDNSIIYSCQAYDAVDKNCAIITIDGNIQKNPYTHFTVGNHGNLPVDTVMTIRRPILCEYIDGMENWDWESIGYFTGTRNIGNEFMRIGNKNLFDGKIELGGYTGTTGEPYNANDRVRSIKKTYLKPGVYYLSSDNATSVAFGIFNVDGTFRHEQANTSGDRLKLVLEQEAYVHITVVNPDLLNAKIQIEEASSATSYVAHKHNSLHILPDKQIPLTFEQGRIDYTNNGTWANAINNTSTQVIRTQLLDLEPNETYRVSCGRSDFMFAVGLYNNSLLGSSVISYTSDRERYITTTKDVHKIGIATMRKDSTNITPSVLHQVRLEKVTDVTLRSTIKYRDELDLIRGIYIQRIEEVILDGTVNNKVNAAIVTGNGKHYVSIQIKDKKPNTAINTYIYNEKLKNNPNSLGAAATESLPNIRVTDDTTIRFTFYGGNNLDLNKELEMLKKYPITVQYVLETPIEHKINIPMKNESNQTIAKPNGIFTLPLMYSETNHVDINSQIYPKVQSRDYISYPVIANNSQLHTVLHNKVGTGNLTVNLCGTNVTSVDGTSKCTITTPSTTSQYELRLSGARNKVSNVCVFSGDYMNVNVPYVEGIMNAVNPIVKNVGKNLFDGKYEKLTNKQFIRAINKIRVHKGQYLTLKISHTNGGYDVNTFMLYDNSGVMIKTIEDSKITIEQDGYLRFQIYTNQSEWDLSKINYIQLEESSTPSQYEPYKENKCEPENGQIKLTRNMFEQGSFNELSSEKDYYQTKTASTHALQLKRIRLIDPIPVKPNTKYIVKFNGLEDYDIFVAYFKNNERVGFEGYWKNKEFTTPSDCNQIVFVLKRKGDAQILVGDIDYGKLIFFKVDETIHLRSLPNGVRDELNLQTGEYIQRIGEVVLDGNIDPSIIKVEKRGTVIGNRTSLYTKITINEATTQGEWVTNTTPTKFTTSRLVNDTSNAYYALIPNTIAKSGGSIQICIDTDLLESETKDGVIKYLSKNPVTYIGELKTPIVKQIDINNFPHSYKDGHVAIESNDPSTNVTAQMTYRCVTNRSGQIQEHTEQVEKQERQINELETLILENIRLSQNRSQNFLTSLISTLEIEEE